MTTLTGKRVTLRPLTLEDCTERYVNWLRDPDVNGFLETRWEEQTLDTVRAFVTGMLSTENNAVFAIVENFTSQHIGNVKIGPMNRRHGVSDLSYFIGTKSYWKMGYGTEVIALAVAHAFGPLGMFSLRAGCYGRNFASQKALRKNGFLIRGAFPNELVGAGGQRDDHLWFGLNAKEYHEMTLP